MSQQAIIQRMLKRNAATITQLHNNLEYFKHLKRKADEQGALESEHFYHEEVKYHRAQNKNYVAEQKLLKQISRSK